MSDPDNLSIEIELTYLASEISKEIANSHAYTLLDIYVPEGSAKPFIRLRENNDSYEITKKKPVDESDASYQTEQTIPLAQDEFLALATSSNRRIEKIRYKTMIDGSAAEVDVFGGSLSGLVMIDFEFTDLQVKTAFQPPSCCLADVTQELFAAGGQLAGKSYKDIEVDLTRFKYKPLFI